MYFNLFLLYLSHMDENRSDLKNMLDYNRRLKTFDLKSGQFSPASELARGLIYARTKEKATKEEQS